MKAILFYALGILFGTLLSQAEVVSWYRIQEMFRFQSFHMYGIIGSAVGLGMLMTVVIQKTKLKNIYGNLIEIQDKERTLPRYVIGGFIFGLGWALSGACPGPMFILIGQGWASLVLVLLSAIVGTWIYGSIKHKLPH